MLTSSTLVNIKYTHVLADYSNPDTWVTETVPYGEIDNLIDQGYIINMSLENIWSDEIND